MTPYYLLIAAIIATTLGDDKWVPRIFRGVLADLEYFPSVVSIHRDLKPHCTGSIINEKWVITAAHCTYEDKSLITIIANSGSPRYKIVDWVRHKKHNKISDENDIGLIKIDGEFDFDDVTQPIQFTDVKVNSTCFVAGWGLTETGDTPKNLQYIQTTVLSSQTCNEIYSDIDEHQICVLAKEGEGPCGGDSGGPLICHEKLAGIVSYSVRTCAAGCPTIFTRIASYKHWIDNIINN